MAPAAARAKLAELYRELKARLDPFYQSHVRPTILRAKLFKKALLKRVSSIGC